jgi:hypothetical protein
MSGAHWLSDILTGSLPFALMFTSVALFTPLNDLGTHYIQKLINKFKKDQHCYE